MTHDLAVLQRRVLLPLKKTEQFLPPNSCMCTKQIGMKKMNWVGEDIKLENSQHKVHRRTLKAGKGAGEESLSVVTSRIMLIFLKTVMFSGLGVHVGHGDIVL